jgi:hypothetical protein
MAGHSRPKDGVASLAYVPAISLRDALCPPKRDARVKPGHDGGDGGGSYLDSELYPTPSFFCRLDDDVVYWNVSFLSG